MLAVDFAAFRKGSFQMRNRFISSSLWSSNFWRSVLGVVAVLAISPAILAQTAGQSGTAKATPDLSGVWTTDRSGEYPRDIIGDQEPPMQPWAAELFKLVRGDPSTRKGRDDMDPYVSCAPRGMPRIMVGARPFEILQIPGRVVILFEADHALRQIFTDGRKLPENPDSAWMGNSVGRWDGDTLIVATVGLKGNGLTWLDGLGHPYSDAMHIVERFRRVDQDTLEIDFTFDDPKTYTKPWSGIMGYQLRPSWQITELINCESHLINDHLQNKNQFEDYYIKRTR